MTNLKATFNDNVEQSIGLSRLERGHDIRKYAPTGKFYCHKCGLDGGDDLQLLLRRVRNPNKMKECPKARADPETYEGKPVFFRDRVLHVDKNIAE